MKEPINKRKDKKIRLWIIIIIIGFIYLEIRVGFTERFSINHLLLTTIYILINILMYKKQNYIFKELMK